MKEETSDFLKKFKNRIEKMGKNGVSGLLMKMHEPINGNYSNNNRYNPSFLNYDNYSNYENEYFNNFNYNNNNNNQIYNIYQNNYNNNNNNNESNNYFKNKGYFLMDSIPLNNKLLKNNPMVPEIKKSSLTERKKENYRSNILSKSVKLNKINKYNIEKDLNSEKNQSEFLKNIDYGYIPYTLKDYKNLPKITLKGGLRSNIGTKENSKWKRSNTYGKRLLDYQRNIIEDKYFFSEKNNNIIYENENENEILKPERDRDTYIKRLEKMKGLLLN